MRCVLLFRHAKSDRGVDSEPDHERPLAPSGIAAAATMGRHLAAIGQLPDHVVASTAVRARETVRLALEAGGWSCGIELTSELYEASVETALAVIRRSDDRFRCILFAGHQPTLSLLVGALVGGSRPAFPTAAMARIDFDGDAWAEVDAGAGRLAWLVTPKLLAERARPQSQTPG